MPKKTKKEKIIAQYRRKLSSIHAPESESFDPETDTRNKGISAPFVFRATVRDPLTAAPHFMENTIRKDLIKTVLLAFLATGGVIGLSLIMK